MGLHLCDVWRRSIQRQRRTTQRGWSGEIKFVRFQAGKIGQMATQCIQARHMRLQARETPRHGGETGLRLNPHLRQRFGAVSRLLFLRRDAGSLLRGNAFAKPQLIADRHQT